MRSLTRFVLVLVAAVLGFVVPAQASVHLMQIEQLIGGVNGDTSAQAIQLRMRSNGQNLATGARLRAWDANGMNPIIVYSFPGSVPNGTAGSRILLCTPSFIAQTSPAAVADGIIATPIPASYLAAGKLTFELGATIYWSVAWGGYAGPNTGSTINDPNGQFSPAFALPLPSTDTSALQFQGIFSAQSSNNAADYMITAGSSMWVNNAGLSFQLGMTDPVGRCCLPGDTCQVLTSVACATAGGTWTADAACDEGACASDLAGACCQGSVCTVRTLAECGSVGGSFRGESTACTSGAPNNFVECCRANFDEENGLGVPDIFAFLAEWFASGDRADYDGNGTREVADIFAFLAAWFAGCS